MRSPALGAPLNRFAGQVAVVTGATSGIGEAVARALAAEGAIVVLAARRAEQGNAIVKALGEQGHQAAFIHTDVRSADSISRMIATTVETYGRLDVAVNNAGIAGANALTADYPEQTCDEVLAVNLKGVWLCLKYEIPHLLERGGAIVNIASDLGFVG